MADDEKERKQREDDRQDFYREQGGLPNGRMRRFIFDTQNDPRTAEGRDKKRADQAMVRTAAEIARWDAQRITIAGVEMTNADAQAARRRVLENQDHYGRIARERGLIKAGQEDTLFRTIREELDLTDRERAGTLTEVEGRRLEAIRQSDIGRAGHEIIAAARADYGLGQARETFRTAPLPRPEFAEVASPSVPAQSVAVAAPASKPVAKPSGLDV